jgi:serine kinase of HPr protein (carbohydrate metabolism regulator)
MRPDAERAGGPALERVRIHATAIAIGEAGILIRGASGSGKSTLALALITLAGQAGRFARLVADDRTELAAAGDRLVARPVAPLEGIVERRGLGLTPEPSAGAVVVRLIVDLSPEEPARMPEPEDLVDSLVGVDLPRLRMTGRAGDERLALSALDLFTDAGR